MDKLSKMVKKWSVICLKSIVFIYGLLEGVPEFYAAIIWGGLFLPGVFSFLLLFTIGYLMLKNKFQQFNYRNIKVFLYSLFFIIFRIGSLLFGFVFVFSMINILLKWHELITRPVIFEIITFGCSYYFFSISAKYFCKKAEHNYRDIKTLWNWILKLGKSSYKGLGLK